MLQQQAVAQLDVLVNTRQANGATEWTGLIEL